jgi:hypothetical protein
MRQEEVGVRASKHSNLDIVNRVGAWLEASNWHLAGTAPPGAAKTVADDHGDRHAKLLRQAPIQSLAVAFLVVILAGR